MLEIRCILCPLDFSDTSRHALSHAVTIGGWYGSHITALHVGSPMILFSPSAAFTEPSGEVSPGKTHRQQSEDQVRAWLLPAHRAGLLTDIINDEGNPAACILEHAASLPASLIVMGTHGRGGFERLVLGSVAEKVLRKAKCPVMTVPPPAVGTSKLPFVHLLCPVDFSDSSIAALRFARSRWHRSRKPASRFCTRSSGHPTNRPREACSRRRSSTGSGEWKSGSDSRP